MTDTSEDGSFDQVRAIIADAVLGGGPRVDERLGGIALRPHQIEAVGRIRPMLAAHGGALLADHVGLGKTYVALAIAHTYKHVIVVAPAALRDMWLDAAGHANCDITTITTQTLSQHGVPADTP